MTFEEPFVRWFMVAFFSLFGAWLIWRRGPVGGGGGIGSIACGPDPQAKRLRAALDERRDLRTGSSHGNEIAGAFSLALAVVCTLAPVPVSAAYAIFCLLVAALAGFEYGAKRRGTQQRTAILGRREPTHVIPWYWFASAALATASLGVYGTGGWQRVLVVAIVAVATWIGIGFAARAAVLPSALSGHDVGAELVVDRRLRLCRAGGAFTTAVAPLYVFASFSGFTQSPAHVVSWLLCAFAAAAPALWLRGQLHRQLTQQEYAALAT